MKEKIADLITAAEQGHGRAQYVLGKFYYTGEGVEKDPAMALHWLEKASQQDVQTAMYYLGKLYADDQSAVFDMKNAIYWLKRNAGSGDDGEAQGLVELELSWCFTLGKGVEEIEQDVSEAEEAALDAYVDRATYYLSWVEPNLQTEADVAVDEDSWWYRYVKKGDAHALYWMGMCYQHIKQLVPPRGGKKDVCKIECFRKAAEMGHFGAQHFLGCYFYYGPIRVRDQKEGIRWYQLAAAQGYPDAIEKLEEIEATIGGED